MKKIIRLTNERAWRTYLGGSLIDLMHGNKDGEDTHFPEEWIMSLTACRNAGREDIIDEGMSRDKDTNELLYDIIGKCPLSLLGNEHYKKFGNTTGVLIKIIDSSERLSIQVHPDKKSAKKYFNSDYGKTESWHILGGREINGEKPCIYLGFKKGITKEYWREMFDTQNVEGMLDCLNKIDVEKGDTFLIKGGVPHALGAGCFLLEVQEPTDYTIRTERTTPSGFEIADVMCHQGIGFDNMMECFSYEGMDKEDIIEKYKLTPKNKENGLCLIDYNDTPCFALDKLEIKIGEKYKAEESDIFYGLYVLEGEGKIFYDGKCENLVIGDQFFVGANAQFECVANKNLVIAKFYGPDTKED